MRSNRSHRPLRALGTVLIGTLAVGMLGASSNQSIDQQATYEATVQRTEGGIPHIEAADFASLGFGTGYATTSSSSTAAKPRIPSIRGSPPSSAAQPPATTATCAIPPSRERDATCGGEPWVREISEIDWRRVSRMDFFLPFVSGLITSAQPPPPPTAAIEEGRAPHRQTLTPEQYQEIQVAWNEMVEPFREEGSNGIGLGRDATVDGTGMLLANPHQGWDGVARFYAFHQTLPGELNIVGAPT